MPIRYIGGVEGSGKSAMMCRDLFMHHISGGKVFTFPGFDIYGDSKTDIISETLSPEDWITIPDRLKRNKVAIGIDEVTNFFNNHVWFNKLCDMMAALMAQRRKLEIAILMTGPIFERLPPVIREMVHEVVYCQDQHTFNHSIPRGERIIYYKEDRRGLLSTPGHRFSKKRIFLTKPWWIHYDTYSPVDILHQFTKVKIKSREITIGSDGKLIGGALPDEVTMNNYVSQFNERQEDPRVEKVKKLLTYLRDKGLKLVDDSLITDILEVPHLIGRNGYGSILKSLGAKRIKDRKKYDISLINI